MGRLAVIALRPLLGATALLLLVLDPAHGRPYEPEYEPFYASLGAGFSDFEDDYLGIGYDDRPWTLQAVAGYRYDWLWSVEAAVQTFGDVEARDVPGSGTERLNIATDVDTASLRVRLWFPVSELYSLRRPLVIFGFAGIHASNIGRSALELTSDSAFEEEGTDYGRIVGGGLTWGFRRINLRGSVEWMDLDSSPENIFSATVGVEFNF